MAPGQDLIPGIEDIFKEHSSSGRNLGGELAIPVADVLDIILAWEKRHARKLLDDHKAAQQYLRDITQIYPDLQLLPEELSALVAKLNSMQTSRMDSIAEFPPPLPISPLSLEWRTHTEGFNGRAQKGQSHNRSRILRHDSQDEEYAKMHDKLENMEAELKKAKKSENKLRSKEEQYTTQIKELENHLGNKDESLQRMRSNYASLQKKHMECGYRDQCSDDIILALRDTISTHQQEDKRWSDEEKSYKSEISRLNEELAVYQRILKHEKEHEEDTAYLLRCDLDGMQSISLPENAVSKNPRSDPGMETTETQVLDSLYTELEAGCPMAQQKDHEKQRFKETGLNHVRSHMGRMQSSSSSRSIPSQDNVASQIVGNVTGGEELERSCNIMTEAQAPADNPVESWIHSMPKVCLYSGSIQFSKTVTGWFMSKWVLFGALALVVVVADLYPNPTCGQKALMYHDRPAWQSFHCQSTPSMSTFGVQQMSFPQELIDHVVDYVAESGDMSSLSKCRLAHSCFDGKCLKHMFASVAITNECHAGELLALFGRNPSIPKCVKELTLVGDGSTTGICSGCCGSVALVLRELPHITSIVVQSYSTVIWPEPLTSALLHLLKEGRISKASFKETSVPTVILEACASASSLILDMVLVYRTQSPAGVDLRVQTLPCIKNVLLVFPTEGCWLSQRTISIDLRTVQTLRLYGHETNDPRKNLQAFTRASRLLRSSQNLTHFVCQYPFLGAPDAFDFSQIATLQSLELVARIMDAPNWIHEFFSITKSSVSVSKLGLYLCDDVSKIQISEGCIDALKKLDQTLDITLRHFPSIIGIHVKYIVGFIPDKKSLRDMDEAYIQILIDSGLEHANQCLVRCFPIVYPTGKLTHSLESNGDVWKIILFYVYGATPALYMSVASINGYMSKPIRTGCMSGIGALRRMSRGAGIAKSSRSYHPGPLPVMRWIANKKLALSRDMEGKDCSDRSSSADRA
ncbi:hypothetical protein H0H93_007018 [Arthromyces matolae]|nr:hypothetical protein H0H93_007018 [Arthromyces matolae]